ncbi:MAG: YqgE/AlgH family protein [Actinomycetia bacterium]|nr:YqgE/AlgH family protein [Actinomycetes bacterium]
MSYLAGQLLVASPRLVDPNFARTVVVLLNHDEQGAMGLVVNRPTESPVADHLPEWGDRLVAPAVVFYGGPVEPSIAIGLRQSYDTSDGGTPVPGVGMVNLAEEEAEETQGGVRVYAGYAGWGAGQLEDEIEEESWIIVPGFATDVFSLSPDRLWAEVLGRQGGKIALLASMPIDPQLN